jgi:3D (Asp-Asp-Asp) domain-containing protein
MQFVSISAISLSALALIACGGSASTTDGAQEAPGAAQSVVQAEDAQSPHGRAPTSADAWKEDEAAPATVAETLGNEPALEEADEAAEPEDPGAMPSGASKDGVAQNASALSTTYGTTFNFTYYWVANRPSDDPNQVTLRDCDGRFMTYASYAWRDAVRMEMTGRFTASDGTKRVFNDAGGCWKIMSSYYDWGMGVPSPISGNSYKLRPFRSIAVDRSVLSIGKWYYIKELDGVKMPSPRSTLIHDGCVRAVDTGYGIFGKHIDFFSGLKSAYSTLVNGSSTLGGRSSVTVYDGSAKCGIHIERGY